MPTIATQVFTSFMFTFHLETKRLCTMLHSLSLVGPVTFITFPCFPFSVPPIPLQLAPCIAYNAAILLLQHKGMMTLNRCGITTCIVHANLCSDKPYLLRLTSTSLLRLLFFAGHTPVPLPHSASTPGIFQWLETIGNFCWQ